MDKTTPLLATTRTPSRTAVVQREPMHGQILPHIREDIVRGRWKPGERLSEPALCKEFAVSRTPLRDAFRFLEAEGLIRLVPHVGAIVTEATGPDTLEKLELLIALEQLAAFKVAAIADPRVLSHVTQLHKRMAAAAKRANYADYYRLNDDFHRAIVLGAGNQSITDAHERVMWHVHRARLLANEHEPLNEVAVTHHQAIVDALVQGKPELAQAAIREHLREVTRLVTSTTSDPRSSRVSRALRRPARARRVVQPRASS